MVVGPNRVYEHNCHKHRMADMYDITPTLMPCMPHLWFWVGWVFYGGRSGSLPEVVGGKRA